MRSILVASLIIVEPLYQANKKLANTPPLAYGLGSGEDSLT